MVPICPELQAILADAFERAEPGANLIVPVAARKSVNLRTHLERIITKAGHESWPRLFQNLRASCETDWFELYPAYAVAKWLGHSPKVAAEHYLMSREHHFEDVVTGGRGAVEADSAAVVVGGQSRQEEPQSCDANCDAIATRNATPHASASESAPSHGSTDVVATQEVSASSSGIAQIAENYLMGSTGLEPVTSTV